MKKLLCFLLIICSLSLSGCVRDGYTIFDFNDMPINYDGSKWESDNPQMWFTVEIIYEEEYEEYEEEYESKYIHYPFHKVQGELIHDGKIYDITADFDLDGFVIWSNINGKKTAILSGSMFCNSEKCTLYIIDKDTIGELFPKEYKITLYRTE